MAARPRGRGRPRGRAVQLDHRRRRARDRVPCGPHRRSRRAAGLRDRRRTERAPAAERPRRRRALVTEDRPMTIGALRESGYRSRSVKEELRSNLMVALARKKSLFAGIVGYEQTVVPQIENAILSGQDIIFLGERGQAKTRIARSLLSLLDPIVPAIAGCETNDDPFAPICAKCKYRVANKGDEHTSELQSHSDIVCRLLLEKKKRAS